MSTVAVPKFGDQVTDSSGNTGIAVYDPNTGKLLQGASGYNPNTGTKLPTVKASSSKTTATPVITSSSAAADLANKKAAFNTVQSNNAIQAASLAQQKAQEAQLKQQQDKDMQAQKNVDTQNAQKQQEIAAKNAALGVPSAAQGAAPAQAQTSQQPVPSYGSSVTDSSGNSGSAQFDPNTGQPLTPPAPTADQSISSGISSATDSYLQGSNDIQNQKQQLVSQMSESLNSLMKGTIPLSSSQQSLVSSVQSQLQQNEDAQKVANQSYVGQVSEEAFRAGGEYTNSQMSGQIANAISYGVAKVAALDNDAAKTIADLDQSFQKDNFDIINQQYDMLSKQLDDKSAALKDTYDTVTKQLTDQRNYNMDLAKFAQTQDQDSFDRAFRTEQQVYAEKQGDIDNKFKQASLNLEQQKFNASQQAPAGGGDIPVGVTMTGNNTPNPQDQQAFISGVASKYGAATAALVKGIANYTINPTTVSSRAGGLNRSLVVSLAAQYDPTFSESQFATRQALQTNFASGQYSQNINSLNTAVGHISDILSNTQGLNNSGFPLFNSVINSTESALGVGAAAKAKLNINAATSELATVFKGSGATDPEIKALGSITVNSSPDQIKQYIEGATQLLGSRLSALDDTYTAGMGKSPSSSFLSPSSQQNLLSLQSKGLSIQIPELQNSPIVKIKQFHDSSPSNAQAYDSLVAQFPNATPDQIQQALNIQ